MSRVPFCGPTYSGRSLNVNASRCVNFFPESNGGDDKSKMQLVGTPGLNIFAVAGGADPIRGLHTFGNTLYAVIGNKLYGVSTGGAFTSIGTLTTSSGTVSMEDNGVSQNGVGGNQLIVVDGTDGYIYNVNTLAFSTISGGGWADLKSGGYGPIQVTYLDGYFIVINGSMSYWVSDLYDGTTWNALATASASASSDNILSVIANQQQLFLIKNNTTEVWYDALTPTSSGSPFSRQSGAVFDYGTSAKWSVARGLGNIFFIATMRQNNVSELVGIAMISGYNPQIISTPAINYKLEHSTNLANCFGYCYSDEGHSFYVLTNPDDNWTIVYDATTNMWHERSSLATDFVNVNRHIGSCYSFFNKKHYVGDYQGPYIYEMSYKYYTDFGNNIYSWRSAQHLYDQDELNKIFISLLVIDMETGVGTSSLPLSATLFPAGYDGSKSLLITAAGSITAGALLVGDADPEAFLSWSDDGGHTWSNQHSGKIGPLNHFTTRLRWRRLGKSSNRVFKLGISDPVKKVIIDTYIEAGV